MSETRKDVPEQEPNMDLSASITVIPIIQEQLSVDKKIVETGKVHIKKRVLKEDVSINIPVVQEAYTIQKVSGKGHRFDQPPPIRQEGGNMIIPVIREVVEVKIRYEVIEELHVIKTTTEVPHLQQISLSKENIEVERISS